MGAESYRVYAGLGLNVQEALAAVKQVIGAMRDVIAAQKDIVAAQKTVSAAIQDSAKQAKDFANQMERAARASSGMASTAAAASNSVRQAAAAAAQAGTALVPSPRLLSAPNYGFSTQGGSYGPGTDLVPVGSPYARSEYMGARAADGSAVVPYAGGGGVGYRGGTIPPGAVPPGEDESYFGPGGRGPVPLFGQGNRGDYYSVAWGAQMAGRAAGSMVDNSFGAAAGVDQLKGALKTQGFTDKQTDAAYDAAVQTQKNVAGAYVGQSLALITMLMKQTQNADEAIALLEPTARAQAVFKGLGRGDGMGDISSMLNAAELRGVILKKGADGKETLDLPSFQKFVKNIETITAMSGGQIGPTQMYEYFRSGGVAAKMLTDAHGFADDLPFIQSMGAQQAGTGLQGFSQQFSGGKMSQAAVKMMIDMGFIDEDPNASPKDWKHVKQAGLGNYLLMPGAMKAGDLGESRDHPAQFILERLLPAVDAWLAKNYGTAFTGADQKTRMGMEFGAMQTLAARVTGGKEMAQAVSLAPYIDRDIIAQQKLQNNDPYKTAVENNPMMALESYKSALNALMITLGNENMALSIATMKALTGALNAMSSAFAKDPQMGAQLMLIADALKVLAPVIATIAIAAPAIIALKTLLPGFAALRLGPQGAIAAGAADLLLTNADKVPRTSKDIATGNWKDIGAMLWSGIQAGIHAQPAQHAADLIVPAIESALGGIKVSVTNYIDGKPAADNAVKTTVKAASGPLTGTGDHDASRSYTPAEH